MNSVFCSICADEFNQLDTKQSVVTPCGHIYHNTCLKPWLQNSMNLNCPDCRCIIVPSEIKRIYLHFQTIPETTESFVTSLKAIITAKENEIAAKNAEIAERNQELTTLKIKFKHFKDRIKMHIININTEMKSMRNRMLKLKTNLIEQIGHREKCIKDQLHKNQEEITQLTKENHELNEAIGDNRKTMRRLNARVERKIRKIGRLQNKIRKLRYRKPIQKRVSSKPKPKEIILGTLTTKTTRNRTYEYCL